MALQKIKLSRIKVDLSKQTQTTPDYEGFFSSPKGEFYIVGWLHILSSDLDLTIEKVDETFLKNRFNSKKYFAWKINKPKG